LGVMQCLWQEHVGANISLNNIVLPFHSDFLLRAKPFWTIIPNQ
jgi:hypothetical protein